MNIWVRCERVVIVTLYALIFWVVLPALLLGAAWWLDRRLGWDFDPGRRLAALGAAAALLSGCLLVAAVIQYWTATGSPPVSVYPSPVLLEQGLYAYWRHPIYAFFAVVFAGIGLWLGSGGMLAVVLPVFVAGAAWYANWEERGLQRRFGPRVKGYRQRTGLFVPRLVRAVRPLGWALATLIFRYEVVHRDRLPRRGPYFVLAAHRSYLDPVFVSLAVRDPVRFVTTYEMFRSPLRAWLFRRLFALPLRRFVPDAGAARSVYRAIDAGWAVGVFPEGERSWTGELGPLRPEVLRLLRRHAQVEIVVLRIDGNALAWPRWRNRCVRAPVRVTVQHPIRAADFASPDALETRLVALLTPDDGSLCVATPRRASGLGRVLYRCPVCRERLPLLLHARSTFVCPRCATTYELGSDHRVRFVENGHSVTRAVGDLYQELRVGRDDWARFPRAEIRVEWAEAPRSRFGRKQAGTVVLTSQRLLVPEAGLDWPLASIGSVTVEGNDRLQVYQTRTERLVELVPLEESALYCQDLLLLARSSAVEAP
jgi:1-acyl-sn-glycerol-3-phosphate acyltransferase